MAKRYRKELTSAEELKIQPPHSTQLEQALLGAMLLDRQALVIGIDILEKSGGKDVFYFDQHKMIYEKLLAYSPELADGSKPDIVVFTEKFGEKEMTQIGGTAYFLALVDTCESHVAAKTYAEKLVRVYKKRKRYRLANDLKALWYEEHERGEDECDFLEESEKMIRADLVLRDARDRSMMEILKQIFDEWTERAERGGLLGIPSHLPMLDNFTGGWVDGSLIVLGGRPAMGKTSLALQFCDYATKKEKRVCFVSLEMSDVDLAARLVAQRADVNGHIIRINPKAITEEEWDRTYDAFRALDDDYWIIKDRPGANLNEVIAAIENAKIEHDIALACVDYLQLMSGMKPENLVREIAEATAQLKALARRLHIPIFLISQLSREVDKKKDKRPTMSDLRDSGGIEQNADLVLLCYRHSYYEKDIPAATGEDGYDYGIDDLAEIIIAKNRFGPCGTYWGFFDAKTTKFIEQKERLMGVVRYKSGSYPDIDKYDLMNLGIDHEDLQDFGFGFTPEEETKIKTAKRLEGITDDFQDEDSGES